MGFKYYSFLSDKYKLSRLTYISDFSSSALTKHTIVIIKKNPVRNLKLVVLLNTRPTVATTK